VHALGPLHDGWRGFGLGAIQLAGVKALGDLVLELVEGEIARKREGSLAVLALTNDVPLRDLEEDALHVR